MEFLKRKGRNISGRSIALELNKVTSSWSTSQEHATLDSVSLCFKKSQLCAIIGPVGCGKVIYCEYSLCQFVKDTLEVTIDLSRRRVFAPLLADF